MLDDVIAELIAIAIKHDNLDLIHIAIIVVAPSCDLRAELRTVNGGIPRVILFCDLSVIAISLNGSVIDNRWLPNRI